MVLLILFDNILNCNHAGMSSVCEGRQFFIKRGEGLQASLREIEFHQIQKISADKEMFIHFGL